MISIGLAFFTAQRTARVETTKALVGAHQTMLVKLIEARLNTYPHMHTLLFNAYFSERTPDVTEAFDELKRLRDDVNAWFSCNGLLLGAETALACYELRRLLRHACVLYEDKSVDAEQRRQTQEALAHAGKHLLLGLRSDIGIYGINVAAGAGIATPIRSDWWSKSPEGPTP